MASSSNRTILQPRSRLSMTGGSRQQTIQAPTPQTEREQPPTLDRLPYESQQRILSATTMLEENELLVWTALDRNESLPQTKLHFERSMLFIDSDGEGEEDDDSGNSGSIEWEETAELDEDDEKRLKSGIAFGAQGWWDPKEHVDAAQRIDQEIEKRRRKMSGEGKLRVKREGKPKSPESHRKRRSIGSGSGSGTPDDRRRASGKRPLAGGSSEG